MQLQLSASSVEKLEAAQRTPGDYADLSVRVAGYSGYFVRLDPDTQEYIIGREKHRAEGVRTIGPAACVHDSIALLSTFLNKRDFRRCRS